LHHRWRARAADLARVGPDSRVLDVACGTGDLALELARRVGKGGEVVGCDFSENMLAIARQKAAKRFGQSAVSIRFEWADALELPYEDDSFDAATVGFGARNFADLPRGLAELARVVRPGGRVVVLDFTTPTKQPLALFYGIWFDQLVPLLGSLTAPLAAMLPKAEPGQGEVTIAEAYAYLPGSVKRFLDPAALAGELERVGLCDIRYLTTAGGIVVIHVATVPM
jgi:demethylmenaquinone methyltransferase/2-methoxy-6-polyprenyl-1,4-benzoquinol methylase